MVLFDANDEKVELVKKLVKGKQIAFSDQNLQAFTDLQAIIKVQIKSNLI